MAINDTDLANMSIHERNEILDEIEREDAIAAQEDILRERDYINTIRF